jgi:hypothetical protein
MADKRAYFKLDVGYMSNPKVLSVLDESPTAVLLHVASIGYAAQHLTDGVFPVRALLRMTGATREDADLLFAAGLWIDGPTGGKAEVHDYLQHQRSSVDVKGASDAARRAAKARWNADGNADRMPDAERSASETAMPREEREEREEITTSRALARDTETRPDVDHLCNLLADHIENNGSKRPAITKGWRDSCRLMLDKDGRTIDEIRGAIVWSQADEFWRSNILSMPKLRDKYDQLRLAAQRPARGGRQQETDALFDRAMARARAMGEGA